MIMQSVSFAHRSQISRLTFWLDSTIAYGWFLSLSFLVREGDPNLHSTTWINEGVVTHMCGHEGFTGQVYHPIT